MCELDRAHAAAMQAKMPQVQWYCEKAKRNIERHWRTASGDEGRAGHLVQRFVRMRHDRLAASISKLQRKNAAARSNRKRVIALWRRAAAAKKKKKNAEKSYEERLVKVATAYTAEACGQNQPPNCKAALDCRMGALNRLRLRSPPLPEWLDLEWHELMDWFARDIAKKEKATVGCAFLKRIGQIKIDLGMWLQPAGKGAPEEPAPVGVGDPDAFRKFVLELRGAKPSAKVAVVL